MDNLHEDEETTVIAEVVVQQHIWPDGELTYTVGVTGGLNYLSVIGLLEAGKLAYHNEKTIDPYLQAGEGGEHE